MTWPSANNWPGGCQVSFLIGRLRRYRGTLLKELISAEADTSHRTVSFDQVQGTNKGRMMQRPLTLRAPGYASFRRNHCLEQSKARPSKAKAKGVDSPELSVRRIERRATVRETKQKGRCLFTNEAGACARHHDAHVHFPTSF